jgi:putative flippase GtrA
MLQRILRIVRKWLRYNTIGVMGVGVQISVLILLRNLFEMNYFVATLIAVQCALIHNFFWHQRWTWRSQRSLTKKQSLWRFVRFNGSSGTISMIGNVGFTALLVQAIHLPYIFCNLLAIGACNIANFLFAHNFVFQTSESADLGVTSNLAQVV